MRVAVMQPYFFPYLGYFQLMAAVDVIVFLDDAQYINRGYVNRNAIMVAGGAHWLSRPVSYAPREAAINERHYIDDARLFEKWERTLQQAYGRTPFFLDAYPHVSSALKFGALNVAEYNATTLRSMAVLLGIGTRTLAASDLGLAADLRGERRILAICSAMKADVYVNAAGGVGLYGEAAFRANGCRLFFLNTGIPPTDLAGESRHLSVIHHLLTHGIERTKATLSDYRLVPPAASVETRLA